jgi:hypothetical protein
METRYLSLDIVQAFYRMKERESGEMLLIAGITRVHVHDLYVRNGGTVILLRDLIHFAESCSSGVA